MNHTIGCLGGGLRVKVLWFDSRSFYRGFSKSKLTMHDMEIIRNEMLKVAVYIRNFDDTSSHSFLFKKIFKKN